MKSFLLRVLVCMKPETMVVGSLHQLLKLLNVLVKTRQQFLSAPDFLEHTCDVLVCPRLPHERRVANPVTLNDAFIISWPAVVGPGGRVASLYSSPQRFQPFPGLVDDVVALL